MREGAFPGEAILGGRVPWRRIGVLSALLMELTLLVPWLRLVLASAGVPPAWVMLLWAFGLALLARRVVRWSQSYRLKDSAAMVFSGLVLLLAILLSVNLILAPERMLNLWAAGVQIVRGVLLVFPPGHAAVLALASVLIWRRGVASSMASYQAPRASGFRFRLGVLIFALYVIVVGRRGGVVPELLPTFFLSGLLAMSISRAHWLTRLRGAGEPPFTWGWLGSLMALFTIVVGVGLGLGWLMNSPLGHRALNGLILLGLALAELTYRLMLPLLLVLEPWMQEALRFLRGWLEGLPGLLDPILAGLGGQVDPAPADDPGPLFRLLAAIYQFLQLHWPVIRIGLLALAALAVFYLGLRYARRQAGAGAGRELPRDAGENLLGRRARRGGLEAILEAVRGWGSALRTGRLRTAIVVRRTYAQLLDLAEEHGRARMKWETPLEFEAVLGEVFPEAEPEVQQITRAYIKVRYGLLEQTADMVEGVQSAWRRVHSLYAGQHEGEGGNQS